MASAFLFSGFLSVASLLLVLSRSCKGAQITARAPGSGLVHVRSVPLNLRRGPLSRATQSGLVPSPPGRPRLRPPHQSRADPAERPGFRPSAEALRFPPPHPSRQSSRGSPPSGRSRTSSKGDGGFWGACSQAGRAGYPGELGSTQRTRVPGPPGEVASERAGSEKAGLHCARSAPEQRGGAAPGLAGGGSRARGGAKRSALPEDQLPLRRVFG